MFCGRFMPVSTRAEDKGVQASLDATAEAVHKDAADHCAGGGQDERRYTNQAYVRRGTRRNWPAVSRRSVARISSISQSHPERPIDAPVEAFPTGETLESIDIDNFCNDVPPHSPKRFTTANFGHVTFDAFDGIPYGIARP